MSNHRVVTSWVGYCASCPSEQPLLLVSHGPQGLRGWLAGAGPEDRTLSYACETCGRSEHVPLTEPDDEAYDATLLRWPDWVENPVAAPVVAQTAPIITGDVFGLAALRLLASAPAVVAVPVPAAAARRAPVVSVAHLPVQRVNATDLSAVA